MLSPVRSRESCPYCGTKRLQWKETALLGCPLCYEVFAEDLAAEFGIALSQD
ncbi:MAG: hypothetical protein JST35_01670 [Armatimonadetes bacterium]|nr:hypothetical protein [Armatimonadota bacterium]